MSVPPIRIPWAFPPVGQAEADAARRTILDTRLSMGASVRAFETAMAEVAGRVHAVAVSNGTDALEVAMRLIDLRPGDEVIVSSLSYIATVNCIVRVGAIPVFADVDPATLNIDPESAASLVGPRTRALIASDYCGFAVDYRSLNALVAAHGLAFVVDGAQSIGTEVDGRSALAQGDVSTTSFHAAKIMTTGEGGMVFFDDEAMLERARRFRGQGEVPGRKYIHDVLGFNHRLTDVQGAIGLVQLERLPELRRGRTALAEGYLERLAGRERISCLAPLPGTRPAWFSFPVLVDDRDAVAEGLRARGIETRSLYPIPTYRQPIPEYPPAPEPRPAAERASARVLNLPMFHSMSTAQLDEVCEALLALVGEPQRVAARRSG